MPIISINLDEDSYRKLKMLKTKGYSASKLIRMLVNDFWKKVGE